MSNKKLVKVRAYQRQRFGRKEHVRNHLRRYPRST